MKRSFKISCERHEDSIGPNVYSQRLTYVEDGGYIELVGLRPLAAMRPGKIIRRNTRPNEEDVLSGKTSGVARVVKAAYQI